MSYKEAERQIAALASAKEVLFYWRDHCESESSQEWYDSVIDRINQVHDLMFHEYMGGLFFEPDLAHGTLELTSDLELLPFVD